MCQNTNKGSVVAHILYWLIFFPIALAGLVIAVRLHRRKLFLFEKRNKEEIRRASGVKRRIKHYCCANKAVFIGTLTVIYSLRRLFYCIAIDELYVGSFLRRTLSILWLAPCLAGVLYMDVHIGILRNLKTGERKGRHTLSKLVVNCFIVTIVLCFLFQFFHLFSTLMNFDVATTQLLDLILEKYLLGYLTVFYSVSSVVVVVYLLANISNHEITS